jgi:hypothetical protein
MQQAYEDAKAKLVNSDGTPSRQYQAYLKYEQEYKSKIAEMNTAYREALADPMKLQTWPIEGRAYHDDADQALDRWIALGFKYEIENAINTLVSLAGEEGSELVNRLRAQGAIGRDA